MLPNWYSRNQLEPVTEDFMIVEDVPNSTLSSFRSAAQKILSLADKALFIVFVLESTITIDVLVARKDFNAILVATNQIRHVPTSNSLLIFTVLFNVVLNFTY